MTDLTFKQRVAQIANDYASVYEEVFMKYEYLVCSKAFSKQDYYIISACADNYKHLIGVNTTLSAGDFFAKCLSKKLTENDFDFIKFGQSESAVKGSVRRKIQALPLFLSMLNKPLVAQENFVKNKVSCSFATTDESVTVGFISTGKSRPMTLLKGNELDKSSSQAVELILSRPCGTEMFDTVVFGDSDAIERYLDKIGSFLTPTLSPNKT